MLDSQYFSTTGLQRALDSFVFLVENEPASLDKERFINQNWKGVSVVGAVASLVGKDSWEAQCGWFHSVTWRWMCLPVIREMRVKSDKQFRGG